MIERHKPASATEFITKSGYLGWIQFDPRGHKIAELSLYSKAQLARRNIKAIRDEWAFYLSQPS
jgi:hypothetical protein